MKKITSAYVLIALTALIAGSALADAPPGGSYQQSCSNASFDGHTLCATCLTIRGAPVSTCLQFADRCGGDIANINGVLLCR